MSIIACGGSRAHLDFVFAANLTGPAVVSYYDRSLTTVKSIAAMCGMDPAVINIEGAQGQGNRKITLTSVKGTFDAYFKPVINGKEKFYHALLINSKLNDSILLMQEGKEAEIFYDFLMGRFELPLMREWAVPLYEWFRSSGKISSSRLFYQGEHSILKSIPLRQQQVPLEQVYAVSVCVDDNSLKTCVGELFRQKKISISKDAQHPLKFSNMDEYFKKYGTTLVKNLEKQIHPLHALDGEAHDFTLKTKRLYPQQIAQLNGIVALMEHGNYAIVNHGMGTGKTVLSAAVAESFFTRKWFRRHPGKNLADAYEKDGQIVYRNIVMCPGHLVKKWEEEIRTEVPYAKTEIITDFSQLLKIRERGKKRSGKEWFILSKDFCKMSFQREPTPKRRRFGVMKAKVCNDCGANVTEPGTRCICGSSNLRLEDTSFTMHGMVCPHCRNILPQYMRQPVLATDYDGDNLPVVLDHDDFTNETVKNSRCFYCDAELWQPHVSNLGDDGKKHTWIRATHYANKAHKGKKTVWVHREYMEEYFQSIGEKPLNIMWTGTGVRRYAPSLFIKKYLKGYFDMAFFDEAHCYKGGDTGQGHAMHALIRASKKHVALTGTILNGKADSIYYLLWRLNPKRMKEKGYRYSERMVFAERYGKIDRTYEYNDTGSETYKVSCKGKQVASAQIKPGISPLVLTEFLLDCTTFLDLTDMSKYLPALKETVVLSHMGDEELETEYKSVIKTLNKASKTKQSGGRAILGTMLQFSLAYPDKPYLFGAVKSPKDGSVIVKPKSFNQYSNLEERFLLSKEKDLIDIINGEIAEGRNCFVYAEYTASAETCVTYRLKAVIEKYCNLQGKVEVLESNSPKASEREKWMHKKAKEGIRVFITNPRCVETGLDFCFKEGGKFYNYPTIIFYQLGWNLFTVWQASRRHYRLNQTKECRTYYMAYAGTIQQQVISLIAEKQSATSAIQGKFSTEGLSAMANGTDVRMQLAQALSRNDTTSGTDLQGMFDVLSSQEDTDTAFESYKPMQLFHELLEGIEKNAETFDEVKMQEIEAMSMLDLFDFNSILNQANVVSDDADVVEEVIVVPDTEPKKRVRKVHQVNGQLSLFSI